MDSPPWDPSLSKAPHGKVSLAWHEKGRQSLDPVVYELPAQQGATSQQVPTRQFPTPDARFNHDVACPLPPSNGFTDLFTCVDRYTCWAEARHLPNTQAETIVKAFVSRWVAMFGVSSTVQTDRGVQFESALFQTLLNFLGCIRIRTTAYHPVAIGMVERFHRQLKTALPLALLGIRAAPKSDLGCSAAELVFGTILRLPGERIIPISRGADETPDSLVYRLRQFMRSHSPCDRVRQPLESPYEGPSRMFARNAKTCRILRADKEDVTNVDRVKAAVAEEPPDLSQGQKCADLLTPAPPSSLFLAQSPYLPPRSSSPLPFNAPSRILLLPMSTASNCEIILHHSTQSNLFDCTSCLHQP
nr:unnamed protein product [Spirometra erinaceieuropaei]